MITPDKSAGCLPTTELRAGVGSSHAVALAALIVAFVGVGFLWGCPADLAAAPEMAVLRVETERLRKREAEASRMRHLDREAVAADTRLCSPEIEAAIDRFGDAWCEANHYRAGVPKPEPSNRPIEAKPYR